MVSEALPPWLPATVAGRIESPEGSSIVATSNPASAVGSATAPAASVAAGAAAVPASLGAKSPTQGQ